MSTLCNCHGMLYLDCPNMKATRGTQTREGGERIQKAVDYIRRSLWRDEQGNALLRTQALSYALNEIDLALRAAGQQEQPACRTCGGLGGTGVVPCPSCGASASQPVSALPNDAEENLADYLLRTPPPKWDYKEVLQLANKVASGQPVSAGGEAPTIESMAWRIAKTCWSDPEYAHFRTAGDTDKLYRLIVKELYGLVPAAMERLRAGRQEQMREREQGQDDVLNELSAELASDIRADLVKSGQRAALAARSDG